jgi:hypothetical protein
MFSAEPGECTTTTPRDTRYISMAWHARLVFPLFSFDLGLYQTHYTSFPPFHTLLNRPHNKHNGSKDKWND